MVEIAWHTKEVVELRFSLKEAQAIKARDLEVISDFDEKISKFVQWVEDDKRINTKRILETIPNYREA